MKALNKSFWQRKTQSHTQDQIHFCDPSKRLNVKNGAFKKLNTKRENALMVLYILISLKTFSVRWTPCIEI